MTAPKHAPTQIRPGVWRVTHPDALESYTPRDAADILAESGATCRHDVVSWLGGDEYAVTDSRAALVAVLRAILFQVVQGPVYERDACITQARAALAQAEGGAS